MSALDLYTPGREIIFAAGNFVANQRRRRVRRRIQLPEREEDRKMPYGSSRVKLPKTVVSSGAFSYGKRIVQQEDYIIGNITKAHPLWQGEGFNQLKFDSSTGEMPVWVCDLTTFANQISVLNGSTYAYKAYPFWKLNFTKGFSGGFQTWYPYTGTMTGNQRDAPFFENCGFQYTTEKTTDAKLYASPPSVNMGKNAILKWVDFRGLFYGVNNRQTDWYIDVLHVKDPALHIIPEIDMQYTDGTVAIDDDVQKRRLFWSEVARKLVANPLTPQFESWRGKVKTIYREKISIAEKETTYNSLHSREKRIFLKLNKLLNYQWRNLQKVQANANLNVSVMDPTVVDYNATVEPLAAPDQRVYLVIRATSNLDYAGTLSGGVKADTIYDTNQGTTSLFFAKDGVQSALDFAKQDGQNLAGLGLPDCAFGSYSYATVDGTGIAQKQIKNIAAIKNLPNAPAAVVQTGSAVGADVPSFDFVLRAKWVYSAQD